MTRPARRGPPPMPTHLEGDALLRVSDQGGRIARTEELPHGTDLRDRLRIAHENYARQGRTVGELLPGAMGLLCRARRPAAPKWPFGRRPPARTLISGMNLVHCNWRWRPLYSYHALPDVPHQAIRAKMSCRVGLSSPPLLPTFFPQQQPLIPPSSRRVRPRFGVHTDYLIHEWTAAHLSVAGYWNDYRKAGF
jgi:hypothetical protein